MDDNEVDRLWAMPAEVFQRQVTLETIASMRAMSSLIGEMRGYFVELAGVASTESFEELAGKTAYRAVQDDTQALLDALDRSRASVARFNEIAEGAIDQTGLLPLPDDLEAWQWVRRTRQVADIANARLDGD